METDDRNHFSVKNGVNRLSILDNAPLFDITQCLPQDIMHVLMECVLDRNCGQLLNHCIFEKRYFTLKDLNTVIRTFNYGEHEKFNQPRLIERDRVVKVSEKLGQSGERS